MAKKTKVEQGQGHSFRSFVKVTKFSVRPAYAIGEQVQAI